MTLVVALQAFHYNDGIGVSYAGIGEEFELPDHLVSDYVSIGRVRALALAAEPPPDALPPEAPAPAPPAHALDHDGDGKPGGSLPSSERGFDDLWAEAESLGLDVDRRRTGERARTKLIAQIEKARGSK